MKAWYSATVDKFLRDSAPAVDGTSKVWTELNDHSAQYLLTYQQKDAWKKEISIVRSMLVGKESDGRVYFEYEFSRIGRRADVVLLLNHSIYCLEFKINLSSEEAAVYSSAAKDQVLDYASEFADFNSKSHHCPIVPILIVMGAPVLDLCVRVLDGSVCDVVCLNETNAKSAFDKILSMHLSGQPITDYDDWEKNVYDPTPSIVQAAKYLFAGNNVADITRSGSDVVSTIAEIDKIITFAKTNKKKVLCFVTGEPGAGKTLVGLRLATNVDTTSTGIAKNRVFLSGNLPLVMVLQGALTRDYFLTFDEIQKKIRESGREDDLTPAERKALKVCSMDIKADARSGGYCLKYRNRKFSKAGLKKAFVEPKIQLVSRFRAGYEPLPEGGFLPSNEHVVVFDEAQRAWDVDRIRQKDGKTCYFQIDQKMSEPVALMSYWSLKKEDDDWEVAVVLIGHGQDIHEGESGATEWYKALCRKDGFDLAFKDWLICLSEVDRAEAEFSEVEGLFAGKVNAIGGVDYKLLHLKTTERTYRAPDYGAFIDSLIKGRAAVTETKRLFDSVRIVSPETGKESFFLRVTHDLDLAKRFVRKWGYGTERRYGLIVSSKGVRLRPDGFYTMSKDFDQESWFLDGKESINSSYSMEIAATEFKVQGLEIDYAILGWDGDFYFDDASGVFVCRKFSSKTNKWIDIRTATEEDDNDDAAGDPAEHLRNAYRVLLTRARQGMIIYIPFGDGLPTSDRYKGNYESTYKYLNEEIGIKELSESDI